MISYPPPHGIPQEVPNQPIRIRMDNLPPAKNWRQIRGFLAKFIPYEQVLNVKVLPLMPSMTPPFIPLQSCIVLLRQDTDWPNLLMQLNGIEWDYHTIMAVILPYFIMPENAALRAAPVGPFIHGAHSATGSSDIVHSPMMTIPKHGSRHEHPYDRPHRHGGRLSVHPPFMGPGVPALIHNGQVQQHSSRRLTQIFNEASFRRQMSQRNMYQLQVSNFPPCLHWDEVIKTAATDPVPEDDSISFASSERDNTGNVNGISERVNANRTSSEHLQHSSTAAPQPHVLQDENNEIVPDLTIMTSHPEKYGKLKWTILKDFVKLKCPKLLEMDHKSQGTALSNTREFYVGVYEDSESHVEIILLPNGQADQIIEGPLSEAQASELASDNLKRFKVRATLFQAVIGFHSKELCDLCLQAINDEEYMLGYKLKVHKLAKINSV